MGQQSATGSGPNKKLAKRAAAEVERMKMLNVVEKFHYIAEKLKLFRVGCKDGMKTVDSFEAIKW